MKIQILKLTPNGFKQEEYTIHAAKASADIIAIDIDGIGWRSIETSTISSYTITE